MITKDEAIQISKNGLTDARRKEVEEQISEIIRREAARGMRYASVGFFTHKLTSEERAHLKIVLAKEGFDFEDCGATNTISWS